jgi:hypothetical protein
MSNAPADRCFHCGETRANHRERSLRCPRRDAKGAINAYVVGVSFSLVATAADRDEAARKAATQLRDALILCVAALKNDSRGRTMAGDAALDCARAALLAAEPVPAKKKGG